MGLILTAYNFVTNNTDPFWTSVKLLLRFNGTNGSTVFTDDTGLSSPTAIGNAQLSTAEKKFGTASLLLDGSGDGVQMTHISDLSMGTGDFTIEWWQYWNSLASFQTIYDSGYVSSGALLLQTNLGGGRYILYASGSVIMTESTAPSTGQWYHYALTRSGTDIRLFRDGNLQASATNSTDFNNTSPIAIGCRQSDGTFGVNGYVDDFRITKGVARYTSNFTPPSSEFPTS